MAFKIYNNFDEIAQYQEEWDQILAATVSQVPFLTFDYLKAWWDTRGGGEWPQDSQLMLAAAFEDDQLMGVAPLFLAENLGGQQALMFVGAIEVSDFLDVLVTPEKHAAFLSGLLDFLKNSDAVPAWEVLDLYNILEDSPTLSVLEAEAETRGWVHEQTRLQPSPYITLPGDFDAYLMSIDKKQRHEIRRKLRNVAQDLVEPDFYYVKDGDTLDDEVDAFIAMMAQDPSKKDFLTEPMRQHLHNTARVAFDGGWLHLSFYTLDGVKAAANMSFIWHNRLWLYNSGWEWAYRQYSPGWLLLANLLQWANENGITEFDFMRGDESYKYKFGAEDRFIYRVQLTP
ncbi:MAG: GNAT family N-acetyltransferase [Chloroflexota bacterium]|nr:GNAT family N-acetyltransferase [Chloroflexota bacterium]